MFRDRRSRVMRSRAVRRFLACWVSMAFGPPPSRIFSSSLRSCATRSARARIFDSKRSELGSTLVGRTLFTERAVESLRSLRSAMSAGAKQLTLQQRRGRRNAGRTGGSRRHFAGSFPGR